MKQLNYREKNDKQIEEGAQTSGGKGREKDNSNIYTIYIRRESRPAEAKAERKSTAPSIQYTLGGSPDQRRQRQRESPQHHLYSIH